MAAMRLAAAKPYTLVASWFETRGVCRAPHHEGLRPHPEERPLGRVSKDEATEPEAAFKCGSRRCGVAQRGDDMIDDFLDQDAVVALAHHANHRFGSGRADQQSAMAVEPLFAG